MKMLTRDTTPRMNEIVFIDGALTDIDALRTSVAPGIVVYSLDPAADGVGQLAEVLQAYGDTQWSAIHVISHGSPGLLRIGSTTLDQNSMATYWNDLQRIGESLAERGDLLLYGCNVAQGESGQAFIAALAEATGADVAASTNLTGGTLSGGDWMLEASTGPIEAGMALTLDGNQGVRDAAMLLAASRTVASLPETNFEVGNRSPTPATAADTGIGFGQRDSVSFVGSMFGNTVNVDVDWAELNVNAGDVINVSIASPVNYVHVISILYYPTANSYSVDQHIGYPPSVASPFSYIAPITTTYYVGIDTSRESSAAGGAYNISIATTAVPTIDGSSGADPLVGTSGRDIINGLAGNDTLTGGAGDDNIDGGLGRDTAVYTGLQSRYSISMNSDGSYTVRDTTGAEGTDQLNSIEYIRFSDSSRSLIDTGPPGPPDTTNVPVYRFVNLNNGAYFYTGSEAERTSIQQTLPHFRFEGRVFFGQDSPAVGFTPVYRFAKLDTGGYFYTANQAERDLVLDSYANFRFEGTTFFVPTSEGQNTTPVFRLANLQTGGYLFTSSAEERAIANGMGIFRDEGIAFNSPKEASSPAAFGTSSPVIEAHLIGIPTDVPSAPLMA